MSTPESDFDDNPYDLLAEDHDEGHRWAFGTGFTDPLEGIDTSVPAGRRYLPGTMVLETTWGTRTGWIIVRDVLLIGRWHHEHDRSHTHRRAPTDYDADHVLLRTVRCVNGEVQLLLDCEPKLDYGRDPARWEYSGDGYNEGIARSKDGSVELKLTTDLRLGFEGSRATARHSACVTSNLLMKNRGTPIWRCGRSLGLRVFCTSGGAPILKLPAGTSTMSMLTSPSMSSLK